MIDKKKTCVPCHIQISRSFDVLNNKTKHILPTLRLITICKPNGQVTTILFIILFGILKEG